MRRVVRQDIFNVGRSYGVRNLERKDAVDDRSVELWVEELGKTSSVLAWHPKDKPKDKTLLVVLSQNQIELMRQHARILHVAAFPIVLDRSYHLITLTAPSTSDSKAYLIAYALTDHSIVEAYQVNFTSRN